MQENNPQQELFSLINEGMLHERERIFFNNVKKNHPLIEKHGGLSSIISKLENKHIVIIGAGASLNSNIPSLVKYQQRQELVIISVDMALRPIVFQGLKPSFVISCEATPVDFFSDIDTKNMHLLAFSCISPSNLRKWQGNLSFYNWMIHEKPYDELWKSAGEELGFLATGSIVTSQALALALGVGAASVFMVSNDLAFKDTYYPRGTVREKEYKGKLNRLHPAETNAKNIIQRSRQYEIYRGEKKFYTSAQFYAAKMWMEQLVIDQKSIIYDCSNPGCSNNYIMKISMDEYLKQFDRKKKRKKR
jgi:hypothetical protein